MKYDINVIGKSVEKFKVNLNINSLLSENNLKIIDWRSFYRKYFHYQSSADVKFSVKGVEFNKIIHNSFTTRDFTKGAENKYLCKNKIIKKSQYINTTDTTVLNSDLENELFTKEEKVEDLTLDYLRNEIENPETNENLENGIRTSVGNYINYLENGLRHSLEHNFNNTCIRCINFSQSDGGKIIYDLMNF